MIYSDKSLGEKLSREVEYWQWGGWYFRRIAKKLEFKPGLSEGRTELLIMVLYVKCLLLLVCTKDKEEEIQNEIIHKQGRDDRECSRQ